MNLILIGLMGSGKSAVGRILAEALGRPFVDTDHLVQERTGATIPEIFASRGEDGFRELEAAVVAELAGRDGLVVATGGGAVLRPDNRVHLRRSGLVFWLTAPPEELLARASAQGLESRPLLASGDPLERLRQLAADREEAYRSTAHHVIETAGRTPEGVAEAILRLFKPLK
jgi:shikimate kinase